MIPDQRAVYPLLIKTGVFSHVRNLVCCMSQDLGQIFIKLVWAITGICSPNAYLHSSHSMSSACVFLMNSSVMSAFFSDKNNKAIPDTCKKMCQTRKEILKILNLVAESLKQPSCFNHQVFIRAPKTGKHWLFNDLASYDSATIIKAFFLFLSSSLKCRLVF